MSRDSAPATKADLKQAVDLIRREFGSKFDKSDGRFSSMDAKFGKIDAKFDKIDAKFAMIDARFDRVDAKFTEIDAKFTEVDSRFDRVDARLDGLEKTSRTLALEMVKTQAEVRGVKAVMATKSDIDRVLTAITDFAAKAQESRPAA